MTDQGYVFRLKLDGVWWYLGHRYTDRNGMVDREPWSRSPEPAFRYEADNEGIEEEDYPTGELVGYLQAILTDPDCIPYLSGELKDPVQHVNRGSMRYDEDYHHNQQQEEDLYDDPR